MLVVLGAACGDFEEVREGGRRIFEPEDPARAALIAFLPPREFADVVGQAETLVDEGRVVLAKRSCC